MAIRTYKVTLDSKNTIAPEPVFLRQGDKTGAVVIDATLMDNGAPVSIDGLTPMFKANTADGQAVIADSTGFKIVNSSGGEFIYQVPSQLGSVPGKIKIAYFSLTDSSGNQSTFDIVFAVSPAIDMTQDSAKDWVSNLNEIIDKYNQWVNNAHTSWADFVDSNKEIIESIDPGGTLLAEIIDARKPASGESYQTLGERLNNEHNENIIDDSLISGGYVKNYFEPEITRVKSKLTSGLFTFAQMNDTHWEDIMRSQPYAPRSLAHIRNLLSFSNVADLLLLNGDNNNSDNVDLNVVKHEIKTLTNVFFDGNAGGKADRFIQLGNHDDGTTRRLFQPNYFIGQDNYVHDDFFKDAYRTSESQGEIRNDGSLYFYKDYPDAKIRFISLNTSDILEGQLDDSGSQKYDRWGTHAIRQEQMNWLINVALRDVPNDYHTIVTCHAPLDLAGKDPNPKTHYWNFDVALNVLAAFRDGTAYLGSSVDAVDNDYKVAVNTDFTNQGPRILVGDFAGHIHKEYIHEVNGIACVAVDRSLVDVAKAADIGTAQEDMFDVIQIDTANRHAYVYGFGGSTYRGFDY
ncbi:MAG: BppU family phage baseplate upper protein [Prevotella sp.]